MPWVLSFSSKTTSDEFNQRENTERRFKLLRSKDDLVESAKRYIDEAAKQKVEGTGVEQEYVTSLTRLKENSVSLVFKVESTWRYLTKETRISKTDWSGYSGRRCLATSKPEQVQNGDFRAANVICDRSWHTVRCSSRKLLEFQSTKGTSARKP